MSNKIPVGILGATGIVGQRFVQMTEHHPWFEVAWVAASDRSEGRLYGEAARWKLKTPIPARVAEMRISPARPDGAPKLIFAALDASIAAELEPRFAEAGCGVITNAIGLVLALCPLHHSFGIETVMAVTMQAVSGAGYPGVASLDILGNVIPYIPKEEEKMEEETRKLLGQLNGAGIIPAAFAMSAQCNRVAVEDGHTESISIKLRKKARPEEVIDAWNNFRSVPQELKLPSAPAEPVRYVAASDRPQPRFDVESGSGMTTTVGRLRPCGVLDWKFTVLSHNTVRGAAGAALLNAELLKAQGYLD
jgi:aspartate-semialdehyde dehydrogenase